MWRVERPNIDTGMTFDQCIGVIRKPGLRGRMKGIRQEILDRSAHYDARAEVEELHLIMAHEAGVGDVAGLDLKKNYTTRMVRKGVPARPVYDALMILPANNRCPFCCYGPVETLDHILPKTQYPAFAVKPTNLVGCCDRCNRLKSEAVPTGPGDLYLHPYFDNVEYANWLKAELVHSTPAVAKFYVDAPDELTPDQLSRINNQFEGLGLAGLYSDAAADEIVDIAEMLEEMFADGGAEAVQAHLARQHRSRIAASLNSWRSALYEALSGSDWYCNSGFRIAP
jgi:5-methylcytosine-specific restriction endonuclease McrA